LRYSSRQRFFLLFPFNRIALTPLPTGRCPWADGPRIGKPIEVAYGVLFIASHEASFVTGAELVIDGGYIAQ
jgi:NAD(P)-dependent dehydrogenase (short-subunit alcohol dehydrogenase family)